MDNSPFWRLPAEIRNHIWSLALLCYCPIELERAFRRGTPFTQLRTTAFSCPPYPRPFRPLLSLTETCRQVRAETIGMFYIINTFRCNPYRRIMQGPIFEDVLAPLREQIGEATFGCINSIEFYHHFSDGYLCGSWSPQFQGVLCGMSDYAKKQKCPRMKLVFALPKKMGLQPMTIDLTAAELSWNDVLSTLNERTTQLKTEDQWMRSVYKQLVVAKDYMLASSTSDEGRRATACVLGPNGYSCDPWKWITGRLE